LTEEKAREKGKGKREKGSGPEAPPGRCATVQLEYGSEAGLQLRRVMDLYGPTFGSAPGNEQQ
jgi:hypothetical protein